MTISTFPLAGIYILTTTIAVDMVYRAMAAVRIRLVSGGQAAGEGGIVYALGLIPPIAGIAVAAAFALWVPALQIAHEVRPYPAFSAIAAGATVALVCCGTVCAVAITLGYVRPSAAPRSEAPIRAAAFGLVGIDLLLWAAFEEVVFRGQLLQCLLPAIGVGPAIVLSSVVFGALHLFKSRNAPMLWVLNTVIFGMLAAELVIATGSILSAIALHFFWNLLETPILGLPANGVEYDRGLLCSRLKGPAILTGGGWSLDAGLIATFALSAGLVMLKLLS